MAFSVVLDTCVLYPAHLRDTLLRLGERGLYRVLWSADIIEELRRNLIELVVSTAVDRLLEQTAAAFPHAEVGYESLLDGLTCDPKDRHVLAAAVRADAEARSLRSTPQTSPITVSSRSSSRSFTPTPTSWISSTSPPVP